MLVDKPHLLTTGQAAKLCSVTPDTVLKWIKKGHISAVRTAGGHYRIERRELEPLIVAAQPTDCPSRELAERDPRGLHCWEYLSDHGTIREQCRRCVVYRVRAARCFLVAGLEPDVGHAKEFCQGTCERCVYFRWVNGLATNVLVISDDAELIERLSAEEHEGITLRIARSGYEASTIVQSFQAAFVLVDLAVLAADDRRLLECLSSDPRLPGAKILLIAPRGHRRRQLDKHSVDVVWDVIDKPFGMRQLTMAIADAAQLSRRGHHADSGN